MPLPVAPEAQLITGKHGYCLIVWKSSGGWFTRRFNNPGSARSYADSLGWSVTRTPRGKLSKLLGA